MLADHLSFCSDKGQVQDEVRGDADCQFVVLVGVSYQKLRLGLGVLQSIDGHFSAGSTQIRSAHEGFAHFF